jgi:hypothetical protein
MLHCEHLHTSTVKFKSSQVYTETIYIYNLRRSLSNGVQRLMAVFCEWRTMRAFVATFVASVSSVGARVGENIRIDTFAYAMWPALGLEVT